MLVITKDGLKDIELLQINDLVLSYNENSKIEEYNKVINITKEYVDILYELKINNKIVIVTNTHPFYDGSRYIKVNELKEKSKIFGKDNKYYEIESIKEIKEEYLETNIEVENNHNYYLEDYLVHNRVVAGAGSGSRSSSSSSSSYTSAINYNTDPRFQAPSSSSSGGYSGGGSGVDEAEIQRQARIEANRKKADKLEKEREKLTNQNGNYASAALEFKKGLEAIKGAIGGTSFADVVNKVNDRSNDVVGKVNKTAEEINQCDKKLAQVYADLEADGASANKKKFADGITMVGNNVTGKSGALYYDEEQYNRAVDYIGRGIGYYDSAYKGDSDTSAYASKQKDEYNKVTTLDIGLKKIQNEVQDVRDELGKEVPDTTRLRSPYTGDDRPLNVDKETSNTTATAAKVGIGATISSFFSNLFNRGNANIIMDDTPAAGSTGNLNNQANNLNAPSSTQTASSSNKWTKPTGVQPGETYYDVNGRITSNSGSTYGNIPIVSNTSSSSINTDLNAAQSWASTSEGKRAINAAISKYGDETTGQYVIKDLGKENNYMGNDIPTNTKNAIIEREYEKYIANGGTPVAATSANATSANVTMSQTTATNATSAARGPLAGVVTYDNKDPLYDSDTAKMRQDISSQSHPSAAIIDDTKDGKSTSKRVGGTFLGGDVVVEKPTNTETTSTKDTTTTTQTISTAQKETTTRTVGGENTFLGKSAVTTPVKENTTNNSVLKAEAKDSTSAASSSDSSAYSTLKNGTIGNDTKASSNSNTTSDTSAYTAKQKDDNTSKSESYGGIPIVSNDSNKETNTGINPETYKSTGNSTTTTNGTTANSGGLKVTPKETDQYVLRDPNGKLIASGKTEEEAMRNYAINGGVKTGGTLYKDDKVVEVFENKDVGPITTKTIEENPRVKEMVENNSPHVDVSKNNSVLKAEGKDSGTTSSGSTANSGNGSSKSESYGGIPIVSNDSTNTSSTDKYGINPESFTNGNNTTTANSGGLKVIPKETDQYVLRDPNGKLIASGKTEEEAMRNYAINGGVKTGGTLYKDDKVVEVFENKDVGPITAKTIEENPRVKEMVENNSPHVDVSKNNSVLKAEGKDSGKFGDPNEPITATEGTRSNEVIDYRINSESFTSKTGKEVTAESTTSSTTNNNTNNNSNNGGGNSGGYTVYSYTDSTPSSDSQPATTNPEPAQTDTTPVITPDPEIDTTQPTPTNDPTVDINPMPDDYQPSSDINPMPDDYQPTPEPTPTPTPTPEPTPEPTPTPTPTPEPTPEPTPTPTPTPEPTPEPTPTPTPTPGPTPEPTPTPTPTPEPTPEPTPTPTPTPSNTNVNTNTHTNSNTNSSHNTGYSGNTSYYNYYGSTSNSNTTDTNSDIGTDSFVEVEDTSNTYDDIAIDTSANDTIVIAPEVTETTVATNTNSKGSLGKAIGAVAALGGVAAAGVVAKKVIDDKKENDYDNDAYIYYDEDENKEEEEKNSDSTLDNYYEDDNKDNANPNIGIGYYDDDKEEEKKDGMTDEEYIKDKDTVFVPTENYY